MSGSANRQDGSEKPRIKRKGCLVGCLISLVVFVLFVAVYVWPFVLQLRADMFVEAVSKRNYGKMELLLWLGANVNHQSVSRGGAALHVAARNGDAKMVRFLIQKGARVNATGGKGFPRTPLQTAIRRGHVEVATLLVASGAKGNPQAIFVHGRHLRERDGESKNELPRRGPVPDRVVRLAEIAREDISTRGDAGRTVLHAAAAEGCEDCVRLLTESGADVNTKDDYGWTPLHLAGSSAGAAVLISSGAEINPKDKSGRTPLDTAQENRHRAIATLLRKHGGKTGEKLAE